jgi:hypothetical protein
LGWRRYHVPIYSNNSALASSQLTRETKRELEKEREREREREREKERDRETLQKRM